MHGATMKINKKTNNPFGFVLWDLPVFRISLEWVTILEKGKSSSRTAVFSLWTGKF